MIEVERYWGVTLARRHIEPLLRAHYEEVASKVYTLSPDWERYYSLNREDKLLILLAFQHGECIGYSVTVLGDHLHYIASRVAYNDVIFVSKDHRHTTAGARLMKETRIRAKLMGASIMQWHAKPNTALDKALAKRIPLFENAYQETL
jgi:hypothetical protein